MHLAPDHRQVTLTHLPPLVPLSFFAVAMGREMRGLIEDCDAGVFGHVWDISARPPVPGGKLPRNGRRELRVFYLDGLAILQQRPAPALTYEGCLAQFLPASRGLKGTELQKLWMCGPDLVHDLAEAGLLKVEREGAAAVGPRASHLFSRASIVAFLNLRALGDPRKN